MLPIDKGVPWPRFDCSLPSDVPAPALKVVRPEIVAQLGNPVDVMFLSFAAAFPLCVSAMKQHWSTPKLVTVRVTQNWIASIVLEGPDTKNIQVKLSYFDETATPDEEDDFFESTHRMLPEKWKELYRWFDSFGERDYPLGAGGWINTPFHYSGRLTPEEYRQRLGAKKQAIREFENRVDSVKLRCWLLTEAGDTLWLDEQRCDHKVYHLRGIDFKDVGVIENPSGALDAYLGHFLSGGKPVDFDFFEWRTTANTRRK